MKKPLGRGLDSLIPRSSEEAQAKHSGVVTSNFFELGLTEIVPNDNQPRRVFDKELLEELAESIKLKGVIQPIIVTKLDNGKYMIIEGERRWRASGIAGNMSIPVVVRNTDTAKERLELALITNAQREDLNPVELAVAYRKLMDEHSYKHEDLGVIIGKSRSAVTNRLRLLNLPKEVLDLIESKEISEGHARALLSLEDKSEIIRFAYLIKDKKLSVRDVENMIKSRSKPSKKSKEKQDANILELSREMEVFFNSKVDIKPSKKGGVINIKYNSDDELDTIIKKIRGEQC
ncbi:MAG: ParB/RepB/Spo0J family partition protein [Mucispirillum sp.]|nr:ParB/RepB/Spo0J family partition protein [Mucispirillum sp.]